MTTDAIPQIINSNTEIFKRRSLSERTAVLFDRYSILSPTEGNSNDVITIEERKSKKKLILKNKNWISL